MCAMDAKLNPERTSADAHAQPTSRKRKIFGNLQELKDELKKVSWTTKGELKLSTKVVVGATFVFGFGIYFVDLVIKGCLDVIGILARFVFG